MVLDVEKPTNPRGLIIEAWAQGYLVGSLIIMACVTIANMRRNIILHKLILIELLFGMFHGTFIFTNPPEYHWYLSITAIFLNTSWSLHNVIAWMKNKPFLGKKGSIFYISTVALVQPYWILEIVANFLYFDGSSDLFVYTRPYEALFRDPWWIFTVLNLFWNIKTRYEFGYLELIKVSPRFGVLLVAMIMSIGFILIDILAVTHVIDGQRHGLPDGINPFWKLAFVFKCLTDTIVLDDFKTALDKLKKHKLETMGSTIGTLNEDLNGNLDIEQAQQKRNDTNTNGTAVAGSSQFEARDWTKGENAEYLDLESALRMDSVRPPGPSK